MAMLIWSLVDSLGATPILIIITVLLLVRMLI
jgi:hypothetical protein